MRGFLPRIPFIFLFCPRWRTNTKTVKGVIIHGLLPTKVLRVRKLTVNVEISQTMLFDRYIRFPLNYQCICRPGNIRRVWAKKRTHALRVQLFKARFKFFFSWINVTFDSSLTINRSQDRKKALLLVVSIGK